MIWFSVTGNADFPDSLYKEEISKVVKWVDEHSDNLPTTGRHDIDGDDLYVNVMNYTTKSVDQCMWEAHKAYLDLHFVFKGKEKLGISDLGNMKVEEYQADKDYVPMTGEADTTIELKEKGAILLYPEDAHMTAIQVDGPEELLKAVFKIRIKNQD